MMNFKLNDPCPVCEQGSLKEFVDYFFMCINFGFVHPLNTLKCTQCGESFLNSKDEELINELLRGRQRE